MKRLVALVIGFMLVLAIAAMGIMGPCCVIGPGGGMTHIPAP